MITSADATGSRYSISTEVRHSGWQLIRACDLIFTPGASTPSKTVDYNDCFLCGAHSVIFDVLQRAIAKIANAVVV